MVDDGADERSGACLRPDGDIYGAITSVPSIGHAGNGEGALRGGVGSERAAGSVDDPLAFREDHAETAAAAG